MITLSLSLSGCFTLVGIMQRQNSMMKWEKHEKLMATAGNKGFAYGTVTFASANNAKGFSLFDYCGIYSHLNNKVASNKNIFAPLKSLELQQESEVFILKTYPGRLDDFSIYCRGTNQQDRKWYKVRAKFDNVIHTVPDDGIYLGHLHLAVVDTGKTGENDKYYLKVTVDNRLEQDSILFKKEETVQKCKERPVRVLLLHSVPLTAADLRP